jgi:protein SCO1/2
MSDAPPPSTGTPPERPSRAPALVALVMLAAAAFAVTRFGGGSGEEDLPSLFPIPTFELTDQDGQPFGTTQLRGRVWIASFLFTSCSQACPILASQLANLRGRLARHGERFHVVSISVDPEVDTPERLRAFAERFGGASQWTLLTGRPEDVRATTERAFFQPQATRRELDVAPGYDILHGTGVLLVDRDGRCRGLYPTDGEGLDRLARDVDRLLE